MKNLIFILLIIGITSCSDFNKQEYSTFQDFNKSSNRAKTWFPDCIGYDACNFKSVSDLEPLFAFSVFQYKEKAYYDSVLNTNKYELIEQLEFEKLVQKHSSNIPSWFVDLSSIQTKEFTFYKTSRWYLANDYNKKIMYAILSN